MAFDYPNGATPLDPNETEGLKHPHAETRAELDQLEQQNIQDGYRWIASQRKYKNFLQEDFVLALHEKLFGSVWSWAGAFRDTEKNIGVDKFQIGVELKNLLDDAQYWVEHCTYGREEFAARFHHRLVKIHPFPNGNGRHARILTDVVLEKLLGLAPINWGAGELNGECDHRNHYIQALRAADKNDYGPLIEFVSR
ncbi:MAG: mobile mystery protein B [Gammaproteobacteria bacterium]|nr:mobile mystery protein B [Gammaproteobacteria bacterium]MDH5694309.1 mobile mystery protein B [Gammaproteobacteria bacterium]